MSHHFIHVNNVSFEYQDGKKVLEDVNLEVAANESVAIIGGNGAGKSTFFSLLLGINFPQSGSIDVGGNIVNKKNLSEIRRQVGYVFQNPDDQLFMPSIWDDVAFGPKNYKLSQEEINNRVECALKKVNINHLGDKPAFKLSGGEKSMAAIATVLAMQPHALVLDEPSAYLDSRARRKLINLLNEFNEIKLIATHDLDLVYEVCERTIIFKQGKIIADGRTEKILRDKLLLESAGLELPARFEQFQF